MSDYTAIIKPHSKNAFSVIGRSVRVRSTTSAIHIRATNKSATVIDTNFNSGDGINAGHFDKLVITNNSDVELTAELVIENQLLNMNNFITNEKKVQDIVFTTIEVKAKTKIVEQNAYRIGLKIKNNSNEIVRIGRSNIDEQNNNKYTILKANEELNFNDFAPFAIYALAMNASISITEQFSTPQNLKSPNFGQTKNVKNLASNGDVLVSNSNYLIVKKE